MTMTEVSRGQYVEVEHTDGTVEAVYLPTEEEEKAAMDASVARIVAMFDRAEKMSCD